MEIVFPPFLQPKDKVAIVSPASKIDKRLLKGAMNRLASWHLSPYVEKHAGGAEGTYSGSVKERLSDLQHAFDDEEVKAILCSRGGYGAVHLIDKLDFTRFVQHPKWLIGFSDITALHSLVQYHGIASLHAPMAKQLTEDPTDDPCLNYLYNILFGTLPSYEVERHPYDHCGTASGTLRGGNMSVFNGLRGTPYDIPAEGTVLFIEDVGERPHVIERYMYNLKLGGVLDKLSGLIVGRFTEYDEDLSLGKDLYGALADLLEDYDYPICFGFPVGHVTDNRPLIEGAQVTLCVDKRGTTLSFQNK
jgi:muramoyltetrapeptide carboxypeptidase